MGHVAGAENHHPDAGTLEGGDGAFRFEPYAIDPQTKLVDVFDHNHYEAEHIKGAISLPLSEINENAKRLLKPDETIITYCANLQCPASTKAAQDLLFLGFKNVLNYKGGLTEYKRANLPLEGYWHIIDNVIFD